MTSPLYAFEITLQPQPSEATAGPTLTDAWGSWNTLDVPKESLASPMAIGFDTAFERLAAIERLYAEPDGSFVWTCSRTGDGSSPTWWQVDGNAYAGCCSSTSRGAVRRQSSTGCWGRSAGRGIH